MLAYPEKDCMLGAWRQHGGGLAAGFQGTRRLEGPRHAYAAGLEIVASAHAVNPRQGADDEPSLMVHNCKASLAKQSCTCRSVTGSKLARSSGRRT